MPSTAPIVIPLTAEFLSQHHHLNALARQLADAYAERKVLTDEALKAIGGALWQALTAHHPKLPDELRQAKQKAGLQAVPIIIESDDAGVFSLPWETLYHPDYAFVGREAGFSLSRRIASLNTTLPMIEKGPLRVMLFTSLPDDLDESGRLNVEAEQAAVQEALSELEQVGKVQLEMPDDGRFDTFKRLLHTFKPHLVYLSGHGRFEHDRVNDRAYGTFLFEDEWGGPLPKTQNEIVACFANTAVQAVVLSACQSGMQSSHDLNAGLSLSLAQCGIPHVIGMRESVLDVAGIRFARTFFDALGQKHPIPTALQLARAAIVQPLADLEAELGSDLYRDWRDPRQTAASLGQWCLPMLISQRHEQALIDWQFEAHPKAEPDTLNLTLQNISLPNQFVGRRRELRQLQNRLRPKASQPLRQLLLIGAGGMGKTALMGKLAKGLENDGYTIYAYAARPEQRLSDFVLNLEMALSEDNAKKYDRARARNPDAAARATLLLQLLMTEHHNKVVLFLDNLESVQAPQAPHTITDPEIQVWLQAAQTLVGHGLILLATSRWQLADWPESPERLCHPLQRPIYGDFIAFARHLRQARKLPAGFVTDRTRMRRAYKTLGGNFRALTFFANAVLAMKRSNEAAFVTALAQAQDEAQTDMALAQVWQQRSPAEHAVLNALLAYDEPVPLDGIRVLANDLYHCEPTIKQGVAVSLVEQSYQPDYDCTEYVLLPMLREWLTKQASHKPPPLPMLGKAADYQMWLFEHERPTLPQAIHTHHALQKAEQTEQAHALVLDMIVEPLNRAGLYQTLLEDWLPATRNSQDPKRRAEALNQTGTQHLHLGEFKAALSFFEQSLAITQQIGDKKGEGATLNNISQIYDARGDYDTALDYLKQSLAIRQQIGDKKGEGATLNNISQIFKARGDYDTALDYLKQSLAIQQQIGDKNGEGVTLNNISQIYHARGDYDTALDYLKQSLVIQQQIGDVAGLCATLFNMGHIHLQNNDLNDAIQAWVTVYTLASKLQLAQALAALEGLAKQLGLPDGLQGWAAIAKRFERSE